ncbi:hypothetical protein [Tunicatimonas pelagia]|uniref:hypothetical protein n=1 Tax=Tunicatimonas pelagia TaxID=931531 RepID=UPI0026660059|nr:hypothetical protein [Tunicatimonas pelagia]WKN41066.1 hypothetical protein P0M28_18700 [Tunicatimonas pelagia]
MPRSHLTQLVVLALALAVIIFVLQHLQVPYLHPTAIYWVPFFLIINGLASLVTLRSLQKDQQQMILTYLATTVFRLLISVAIIFFALMQDVPHRITFVINFAVLYLAFLGFEIYGLLTNLRAHLEKDTDQHGESQ